MLYLLFFFQAEDGIRDLVRSRGLGDVYKRQVLRREDVVDGDVDHGDAARQIEQRLRLLQVEVDLSLIHI